MARQIDRLLEKYWQEFLEWKNASQERKLREMTDETARVFIPRRLLELSENPGNVRTVVLQEDFNDPALANNSDSLYFTVYETLDRSLSDPRKLAEYMKRRSEDKVSILPMSQEEVPDGIDYKQVADWKQIQAGKIGLNDRHWFVYCADVYKGFPCVLYERGYWDRKEAQRKGVGTSFYQRLEPIVRHLGFNYLVGDVISQHPGFFERYRIRFEALTDEAKAEMPPRVEIEAKNWNVLIRIL